MRRMCHPMAAFGLVCGALSVVGQAEAQESCLAEAEIPAASVVHYLGRLVTATTDTQLMSTRVRYSLPVLDSTAIHVVRDQRTCAAAASAYAAHLRLPGAPRVLVVRVGDDRLVVWDGIPHAGEFSILVVMDSKFVPRASFTG